ncbi:MAG: hypothetical protein V4608_02375 [Bacteroidota bacterium]
MKPNFFLVIVTLFSFASSYAQSKKDIKNNKIKSITEYVTITENGKENTYKAYYIAFDKNFEVTEETEYNSSGNVKKKSTAKFDANENKMEETYFYQNRKNQKNTDEIINLKTVYKYNAHNDKVEENEFDGTTGALIKRQIYLYNNKGEKSAEETYNADKKLIKKSTFTYDNKGLKTEKKTFNENNILESTKKYVYQF